MSDDVTKPVRLSPAQAVLSVLDIQGPVDRPDEVILVAFQFHGVDRDRALQLARRIVLSIPLDDEIVAGWVAEDDRTEEGDNDSAVFCHKGQQRLASATLIETGVSIPENLKA